MYNPFLTQATPWVGSNSKGSVVLPDGNNVKFLTMLAIANLISRRANLIPMQPLGPWPNGK